MSKDKHSNTEEPLEPEIDEEIPEEAVEDETKLKAQDLAEELADDLSNEELWQLLNELEDQSAKNLEGWQRSQAEFINYRKRIERDQARIYEDAAGRVIKSFLPIMDDLHRALQNAPTEGDAGDWAGGIELIYRKMQTVLESEGVTRMDVDGQMFDPNLHEAISQAESPDHESGQIIEVIQQGYMIGDRVLRAALVRVAS